MKPQFKDSFLIYISNDNLRHNPNYEYQLGLCYLAEYANAFGFKTIVRNYSSNAPLLSKVSKLIEDYSIKIVGFYTDCENIWVIRKILPELKDLYPKIAFILGGPQITSAPEQTLKRIPHVTCGVIGEGELTFLKLLQLNELSFENLLQVKGLALLKNNVFYNTGKNEFISNLNDIPFPQIHLYDNEQEGILFSQIMTGRGCIGKCSFCYEGSNPISSFRLRDINNCIDEIEYLVNQFPERKYIAILDDTFIINRERLIQFCELMIKKYSGKVKWFCEGRVDILEKVVDLFPLMKDAGLIRIQLGGESGCQVVLDAYNKGTTTQQLIKVVSNIYKCKIDSIYINFIIGGAFESIETYDTTLELAKHLLDLAPGCAAVGASFYSPTPGSPMYNSPELYGIKIIDKELVRGEECLFPFTETETLDQYQLLNLFYKFSNTIEECYTEHISKLPKEKIEQLYFLADRYNCSTEWYDRINIIERYKNYFEPIVKSSYKSFKHVDTSEINYSVPVRTSLPTTDGFAFYRKNRDEVELRNSDFESAIITLSAGKLSFSEIKSIIIENGLCPKQGADKVIMDFYKDLDEELNIIWKCLF